MEDRDLDHVGEYHRRLIAVSQQEHILRDTRPAHPGIRDYILLQAGEQLISLGQRLRSASVYEFEPASELSEDCA